MNSKVKLAILLMIAALVIGGQFLRHATQETPNRHTGDEESQVGQRLAQLQCTGIRVIGQPVQPAADRRRDCGRWPPVALVARKFVHLLHAKTTPHTGCVQARVVGDQAGNAVRAAGELVRHDHVRIDWRRPVEGPGLRPRGPGARRPTRIRWSESPKPANNMTMRTDEPARRAGAIPGPGP